MDIYCEILFTILHLGYFLSFSILHPFMLHILLHILVKNKVSSMWVTLSPPPIHYSDQDGETPWGGSGDHFKGFCTLITQGVNLVPMQFADIC